MISSLSSMLNLLITVFDLIFVFGVYCSTITTTTTSHAPTHTPVRSTATVTPVLLQAKPDSPYSDSNLNSSPNSYPDSNSDSDSSSNVNPNINNQAQPLTASNNNNNGNIHNSGNGNGNSMNSNNYNAGGTGGGGNSNYKPQLSCTPKKLEITGTAYAFNRDTVDKVKLTPVSYTGGTPQLLMVDHKNCTHQPLFDFASRPDNTLIVYNYATFSACSHVIHEKSKDVPADHKNMYMMFFMDGSGSGVGVNEKLRTEFGSNGLGGKIKGFLPDVTDSTLSDLLYMAEKANGTYVAVGSPSQTPSSSGDPPVRCDLSWKLDDQMSLGPGDSLLNNFSRTSVLFVSVSFIILMVISLAWLVFYYVQRFRYAHAKDRLARRLFNAAKKVLARIPAKTLRHGDKELDSDCPVCIEPYHSGDVIRTLPCKHVFHKTCVDPWLLEHRTCPMCKMDILKAFGYNFGHSEESVRDADQLSAGGQSTDGRSNGFPVPLPTDSDLHDPFFPSPAPSPSLLQPVLHSNNTHSFSIIPLTVHNNACSAAVAAGGGGSTASDHWATERHSAEVHRGGSDSSASSTSGSDDGHDPLHSVTRPLFRPFPTRPATAIVVGAPPLPIERAASKSAKHHRRHNNWAVEPCRPGNAAVGLRSVSTQNLCNPAAMVGGAWRAKDSSAHLGPPPPGAVSSTNAVLDPPPCDRVSSCNLRNDAAPSLESL